MDLFGNPYDTIVGLSGPGQFQVLLPRDATGDDSNRVVTVAPQRLEVLSPEISEVAGVYQAVISKLFDALEEDLAFSAIGLNTEHEWLDLEQPGSAWITERLLSSAKQQLGEAEKFRGQKVEFSFGTEDPKRRYQLRLEPRAGVEMGIFVHCNDHRNVGGQLPTEDEVSDLLKKSEELLHSTVFEALGLTGEDDGS